MQRQIKECHFTVETSNGTNTSQVFSGNVNIFSGAYTYVPYYYSGSAYDESIRGTLRSQLGGYRFEATLQWNRLINSSPFFDMINEVVEGSSNAITIYFAPDSSNIATNIEVLVVPSQIEARIDGTIVSQPLGLEIYGKRVENTVPSWFKL
jgi:hypothetical protein